MNRRPTLALAFQLRDETLPVTTSDLAWLSETLPPFEIESLRQQAQRLGADGPGESFELQCRNLPRNHEAGMVIGMGTDSGVSVAWTTHTDYSRPRMSALTRVAAIIARYQSHHCPLTKM